MSEIFDPEILRELDSMTHPKAIQVANTIIDCSSMKDIKKEKLKMSVRRAKNSQTISVIMWNALLSGDGLASLDSDWNRTEKRRVT